MNQEVKKQWIAALRSGDYRQGQNALRGFDNTYCCLGVLCELAVQAKVIGPGSPCRFDDCYAYDGSSTYLPDPVIEWAGLDTRNPKVTIPDSTSTTLAEANDTMRSFEQVADLIEAQL